MNIFLLLFSLFFLDKIFSQSNNVLKEEIHEGFILNNNKLISDDSKLIKKYNEIGLLIEENDERIWPMMQKKAVLKKIFYYDEKKRLQYYTLYNDTSFVLKLLHFYDSNDVLIEVKEINKLGNDGYHATKYYQNNNCIAESLFRPDGSLYNVKFFFYDAQNNLIDEYGVEGNQMKYRWKYFYNKKKHLIQRNDLDGSEKLLRTHQYEFIEDKINKETILNSSKQIEKIIIYSYKYW